MSTNVTFLTSTKEVTDKEEVALSMLLIDEAMSMSMLLSIGHWPAPAVKSSKSKCGKSGKA